MTYLYNFLVAFAVLTQGYKVDDYTPYKSAILEVARHLEIGEPQHNIFSQPNRDSDEVDWLQQRYKSIQKWPKLHHLKSLPPVQVLKDWRKINIRHQDELRWLIDNRYGTKQHVKWLEYDERLCQAITTAWDVQENEYYDRYYKRRLLSELVDLIGPENFYSGNFPPPVPIESLEYAKW